MSNEVEIIEHSNLNLNPNLKKRKPSIEDAKDNIKQIKTDEANDNKVESLDNVDICIEHQGLCDFKIIFKRHSFHISKAVFVLYSKTFKEMCIQENSGKAFDIGTEFELDDSFGNIHASVYDFTIFLQFFYIQITHKSPLDITSEHEFIKHSDQILIQLKLAHFWNTPSIPIFFDNQFFAQLNKYSSYIKKWLYKVLYIASNYNLPQTKTKAISELGFYYSRYTGIDYNSYAPLLPGSTWMELLPKLPIVRFKDIDAAITCSTCSQKSKHTIGLRCENQPGLSDRKCGQITWGY